MGNEQSGESLTAPSLLDRVKGVGTPRVPRTDKIIVVKTGADRPTFNPHQDENMIKLQSIPQFLPVLRSLLNVSGLKDPTDLHSKFNARPLVLLADRLQQHLNVTATTVQGEQQALTTRIKEVDYILSTLCTKMTDRMRAYERFEQTLSKIREINVQFKRISVIMESTVTDALTINERLPSEHRQPRLDLSSICDQMLLTAMSRPLALDSPDIDESVTPIDTINRSIGDDQDLTEQLVIDAAASVSVDSNR